MRGCIPSLTLVVLCAGFLRADDGIPVPTLRDLKAATVFVKVDAGRLSGSGSGFLIKVEGETGYVVTNHHVVATPPGRPAAVTLVFASGTRKERSLRAEVLASDPSRDLAVLRVDKVKDLPKPIDLSQKLELVETMTVYSFGFPFGQRLSTTRGNPAMTIGKGTVSSIRTNDRDEVAVVQLDGELNPGNSGGPVVDGKGRLVGVAVAKLHGTRIGLAIPPTELTRMLNGRVGAVGVHPRRVSAGKAEVKVAMRLIDPLNKLKSVVVHYVRADALAEKPARARDGTWAVLAGARKIALKIDRQSARATFPLAAANKGKVAYLVQTVYVTGEGRTVVTQPTPFNVDFGAVAVVPPRTDLTAPTPKAINESRVGDARTIGDVTAIEVKVPARGVPPCLCWSADGASAFFHLEADKGILRRIRLTDLKEEQTLDTGRKCSWISVSAEGVLLSVADAQEAWLLDPKTLKVQAKFEVGGLKYTVSGPQASVAVAVNHRGDRATVLDLRKGTAAKEVTSRDFGKFLGFDLPAMTLDGKYLFTLGGIEQLHRFKIEGTELKWEESSPRIAQGRLTGIDVSGDGKYVCVPTGGGNYGGLDNHPEARAYSTYVYPVGRINRPAFTLAQGAYPMSVGFDAKAGLIYSQNYRCQLLVFSDTGRKLKEVVLGGGSAQQHLVHPEGRRLLVLTDQKLFLVDLPKK